jgi:hypothetical protein
MDETPNLETRRDGKRPHVTPWIARDPIPQAVREATVRQAAAQRAALIQHVLAAPLRGLRRLAHPPGQHPLDRAIAERNTGLLGPGHERALSAAVLERERARAQLLATVFALPGLILGRRHVSAPGSAMQRPAATEGTRVPSPAIDRSDETP